jgi:hypothetical protein
MGVAKEVGKLALTLSINTDFAEVTLLQNSVHSVRFIGVPLMAALGVLVVISTLASYILPTWMSIALAIWPAYKIREWAKSLIHARFMQRYIDANREILLRIIEWDDSKSFADVADFIAKSKYRNRYWFDAVDKLRNQPNSDPYLYLATIFTYAPQVWRSSAHLVYSMVLTDKAPSDHPEAV